jgi:threonine/homoserine/homoserine lactone efflux protein
MMAMLGIHDLWLFVVSALLVNISPGPDSAYIVGRSIQLGWRAGMMAALGISCGCLVHVFGTAIGLSALLMASSVAFTVIKWVGAAYLCYIGITMLLSRQKASDELADAGTVAPRPALSLRQVFWQGVLTDVLNPKVALFFLAFLPQFVDADSPHKTAAFILLGTTFISTGTVWCFSIAALAARVAVRVRKSGSALVWINRALGGVFVYLGVRIAALQAR